MVDPSTRQRQDEAVVTCNDFLIWTFHLLHRLFRMQEKGLVRYVETTFAHKHSLHTSGSARGRKSKQRTYWSMKKSCTARRWLCLEVCNAFAFQLHIFTSFPKGPSRLRAAVGTPSDHEDSHTIPEPELRDQLEVPGTKSPHSP